MDEEVIVIGYWCEECEFFEEEINDPQCRGCGCPTHKHRDVKVVAT